MKEINLMDGEKGENQNIEFVFDLNAEEKIMWLPIIHGFCMATGWSFFIIIGISIACYLPKKDSYWFVLHVVFQ